MSTYVGVGRTNYFKVKDPAAFKAAIAAVSEEIMVHEHDGIFCLFDQHVDGGGWPAIYETDEEGEELDEQIEIAEFVAQFLEDGWVLIIKEIGHEKYRYCSGWATAINNTGQRRDVNLNDIEELAKELGEHVTEPRY